MATAPLTITGCGTALITPFSGGRVDKAALARLVEEQVASGVSFLVPCGTTGESPTLTDAERTEVVATVVEAARGRVPVVAGTGTYSTHHSVHLTQEAKRAGAVACLVVAPYYNKPTQEGIYRHIREIVDKGGLPAVPYHIPGRSVVSIDVETMRRAAAAGGILGIKETGSVSRVTELKRAGIPVLSGDDGITLPMIALGAVGVISVASNVVPRPVATMVSLAREGRFAPALALHERLSDLFTALFLEPNPIPLKAALLLAGKIEDAAVRLPLTEASPATRAALLRALAPFESQEPQSAPTRGGSGGAHAHGKGTETR
jgi:4-hydroxy-tetrahydrodipicolinate synthase